MLINIVISHIDDFKNYDVMKNKLVMEIVSADKNAEFLETVPRRSSY